MPYQMIEIKREERTSVRGLDDALELIDDWMGPDIARWLREYIKELTDAHEEEIAALKEAHEEELSDVRKDRDDRIAEMEEKLCT